MYTRMKLFITFFRKRQGLAANMMDRSWSVFIC